MTYLGLWGEVRAFRRALLYDGLVTCTSTITYGSLRGVTTKKVTRCKIGVDILASLFDKH